MKVTKGVRKGVNFGGGLKWCVGRCCEKQLQQLGSPPIDLFFSLVFKLKLPHESWRSEGSEQTVCCAVRDLSFQSRWSGFFSHFLRSRAPSPRCGLDSAFCFTDPAIDKLQGGKWPHFPGLHQPGKNQVGPRSREIVSFSLHSIRKWDVFIHPSSSPQLPRLTRTPHINNLSSSAVVAWPPDGASSVLTSHIGVGLGNFVTSTRTPAFRGQSIHGQVVSEGPDGMGICPIQ